MQVVLAEDIRELDRRTIEEVGIPGAVLMENAGRGATKILCEHFKDLHIGLVSIVCGGGNNGGDGFVIARYLQQGGIQVKVFLLTDPNRIQGDARIYFDVLQPLEIPIQILFQSGITNEVLHEWQESVCIVDAIFGTGLSRDVSGLYRQAIEGIQTSHRPVFAVDIPSGINADTGKVQGIAVKAECTATFGLPKRGLYLYPAVDFSGHIECVDIGIPRHLVHNLNLKEEIFDPAFLLPNLKRESNTHKGTYGHLFVLAGSIGKTGAAALCSEAALRSGAGLVTLGIPDSMNHILEQKLTEVMTLPCISSEEGSLSLKSLEKIQEFASRVQGLVVGPGLGINTDTEKIIRELWRHVQMPMVWDADALTLLAQNPDLNGNQSSEIIITPHPGEMSRLLGKPVSWVQENRIDAIKSFSNQWGVITVLKGSRTLIADPDGNLRINLTGNPGMASAGVGDVLAGMIGALLVQGLSPFDAASLGVWLHGAAGDRVAQTMGPVGYLATDMMQFLPGLFKELIEDM